MFTSIAVTVLVCAVASGVVHGEDIAGGAPLSKSSAALESKVLFDSIDEMMRSATPENRDYAAILKKTEILVDSFPESRETLTMLKTLERWRGLDLISKEQYAPFEKKLVEYRSADEKGRTIFSNVGRQFERYLSSQNADFLDGIIISCRDILDARDSSNRMKCNALLWLARAYMEKKEIDKSESYLKNLFVEQNLAGQDFVDARAILLEARNLMANILLMKKGMNDAIDYWKEIVEADGHSFDEIAHAYERMYAILDVSYENEYTEEKIRLLEEFIAKYPSDSSEPLLSARLRLGYAILNYDISIDGIVTMERAAELVKKRRTNAEKAEKIFQESLDLTRLAENTSFEQAFGEALTVVAQARNPEYPKQPDGSYKADLFPPKSNKIFTALIIVNVLFIPVIIYSQRKRIMSFVNGYSRKSNP